MGSNRVKNVIRNSISGFINKFALMFFPFLIRTLMIHYMGAAYLGLNSLFTAILQVLSLAELGLSSAIVFCMYKPIAMHDDDTICALYALIKKIYTIVGFVILITGLALIPILHKLVSGDVPYDINLYSLYLIYLFNTVISYFLFAYKECLLVAYQRSDVSNNISTISHLAMYLLQCLTIVLSKNYYAYIFWLPVCTIIINLVRSFEVKKLFPNINCCGVVDKKTKKEISKKVVGLMLYKICGICRNSFDSIVLSSFLGLIILAKYQNYYYIMNSVSSILAIITISATASIGDSIATESIEKNYSGFGTVSFLYNWVSGWCTVCLLCLFQPFMLLWLGDDYLFDNAIVVLMCVYFYTTKISDVLYTYRQAAGLWWEDKARPVIEAFANLILNILVVKYYCVAGVLVSTIVTIAFINIPWGGYVLFKYYFKNVPAKKYIFDLLKNAIVVLIACALTWFTCSFVFGEGLFMLLIKLVICIIEPNLIMLVLYCRSEQIKSLVPFFRKLIWK